MAIKKCNDQKNLLQQKLTDSDFEKIEKITDTAREREFLKHRSKLKNKVERLIAEKTPQTPETSRPSTIKNPVLQLQKEPLPPEALAVLQKGPKFALTHKKIPNMEIIQGSEKAAQELERQNLPEQAEKLRQDVAVSLHSLNNNPSRHKSNLTQTEQKGLKILQEKIKNKEISITPHDKGQGFCVLDHEDLKNKAKAAFQNVTANTEDRTKTHEGRVQRHLLKLKNEGKISESDYFQIRPSGSVPPASYPLIKAHKPNKGYPARDIVSHRGCPQEGLASYLIPLLQPLLNDSPYTCKNSVDFKNKISNLKLKNDEIQISLDAEALYPSVDILAATNEIKLRLENDPTLSSRTKLTANDITELVKLCLSTSDFVYDGIHHSAENSGPIGL